MIELELPYPPSVNHYYRRVGSRMLISREGRRFRQRVLSILEATRPETFEGPIAVQVDVYPPDRRRRDLDNTQKALLDALQHGGVYRDDSQIESLTIVRRIPVNGGCVHVAIRKME